MRQCSYLTTPGATQLTRMFSAAASVASALVSPTRAVLLTCSKASYNTVAYCSVYCVPSRVRAQPAAGTPRWS